MSLNAPENETSDNSIEDLRSNSFLWYKIHVFLWDLRNFQEKDSQARLDNVMDSSYLCLPYFTPEEVNQLKTTNVQDKKTLSDIISETLNERLERRTKKRVESGDFRVCAAHDLAPIFEKALCIKQKDLERDRTLLGLIKQFGLKPNNEQLKVWSGALKNSKTVRTPGQRKKKDRR
ncbi:hypothetical protein DTO212C5_7249 [Paecilomyces variotii]|nr:hypothetical protein DTO212C5_7249 [Paecilomyces variotii]